MAFSFTYRGIRSEDLGIEILNVKRSILPPNNNILIDIPSNSGKYYFNQQFDVKTYEISIRLSDGSSLIDFQNNIR
jgi:phage-related protein